MKTQLFSENFVPYKFQSRNSNFEPHIDDGKTWIKQIVVEESRDCSGDVSGEAYSIEISDDGSTILRIATAQAGLHALNTFAQLFYAHSKSSSLVYTPYAPIRIRDFPVFEHRGLNLDISRNQIGPMEAMRTIEAMSYNKMNRLHLHASDSQSWPLEIPALPDLAAKGAYHPSQIWKARHLEEVQQYGKQRGVEVYIEIDLPGHTASVYHSYPDLITAYNQQPWGPYAQEPPSGQLKLNHPPVSEFLTTLLKDLLPRVSPHSSHFHIGGDELNTKVYELDPTVKSSSHSVIKPLLQDLVNQVVALAISHDLAPITWEDLVLEWDIDLPSSAIIQVWREQASLASVVAKGYKALFGACTQWYLDCGYGTFLDPDPSNPSTPVKPPYLDWCSPYKNWRHVYNYDPLADIPEEHKHLVLGGEVHLWGELVDTVTLDGMLWPRVAAAAEVLWRGKGEVGEDVTRRLAEMRERLVCRGIQAGMVQMEWSLRNPGSTLL